MKIKRAPRDFLGEEEKKSQTKKRQPRDFLGEDENFFQKLTPNILSGIAGMGQRALNAPGELAENLENQAHGFGKLFNESLPLEKYGIKPNNYENKYAQLIPVQNENNLNAYKNLVGAPKNPTFADKAIQKGIKYAPEFLTAGNALRNVIPHLTKSGASKKLRLAKNIGVERKIEPLNINQELIEDARQFLPNTAPYRNAIEAAKKGNYEDLFTLQSDLAKHSGRLAKSKFSASERAHGREGLETRNALLKDIHKNLQEQGHHDISDLLRQGQNDYRRYMRFRPYRNAIGVAGLGATIGKNALIDLVSKIMSLNKG